MSRLKASVYCPTMRSTLWLVLQCTQTPPRVSSTVSFGRVIPVYERKEYYRLSQYYLTLIGNKSKVLGTKSPFTSLPKLLTCIKLLILSPTAPVLSVTNTCCSLLVYSFDSLIHHFSNSKYLNIERYPPRWEYDFRNVSHISLSGTFSSPSSAILCINSVIPAYCFL